MTIEIYRDAWGIPHLRATDARELARAQGRVTAHDRAWQLEVERHRAQGTSASFLGPAAVPWDVLARRARLADTAERSFEAIDADTADWVRAYVEGVNEGLAEGARRTPEFADAGLAPGRWEPWTPLAVWISTHLLFAGFPAKLWREEVIRHLGPEAVALFATDGPGTSGSNGWLAAGERTVTGQAVIAGDPHRFIEEPGVYQQIRLSCPEFDVVGLAVPGIPGTAHFGHTGTVAWAITNAMADYQDLYRERLRRTGAGVEALGPDGRWERAHRETDFIEVRGAEPVPVEVIETGRGPVIAGGPEGLEDGTLLADDPEPPLALSLRHPPRVLAEAGFAALLPLLRARTVADVDQAFDTWVEPVNVVQAADTEGGTLHRVAGRVPVRSEANKVRIVPAWEPGHEWRGWHETPHAGLTDGIAVMANQRGPSAPLGVEFAPPHRADRITALLGEKEKWSAADMPALHMDTHLASAAPLLSRLAALEGLAPRAAALRARLLSWDRRMDATSEPAAVFAAVRGAVVRRLAAHPAFAALTEPPAYPEALLPWLGLTARTAFALENLLTAEELYGIDRPAIVRAALEEVAGSEKVTGLEEVAALEEAASEKVTGSEGVTGLEEVAAFKGVTGLEEVAAPEEAPTPEEAADSQGVAAPEGLSAGPARRTWGDTHRLAPWRALPGTPYATETYAEPALSGDHDCVLCTSAVPGLTDLAVRGPAARYVWDLARREDSLWVVPLGASGVPGSAHHRDQLPRWARGDLVPVVTDWARLTKETDDD